MSVELGQNYRLYIATGASSPFTFTAVAGQRRLSFEVSTKMIDTSAKTSGAYGAQAPARKQLTIKVSGVRDLPDALGLEAAYAKAAALVATPVRVRIMKLDVSPAKVRWDSSMYVANFSETDDDQDAGMWSFDCLPDGSNPIVDDITP